VSGMDGTRIVLDLKGMNTRVFAEILRERGYGWLADQVEEQAPPPRIDEPEVGKFVTATAVAYANGRENFLHLRLRKRENEEPYEWACLATGHVYKWTSLIDPVLVRDVAEEL
jgi:hypothetical protein